MKKLDPLGWDKKMWIWDWLGANFSADVCNQKFHEEYFAKWGGKRKETYWGAQPVKEAMDLLKEMCLEGKIERSRSGLGSNWQRGFPRWVWVYTRGRM